MFWRKKTNNKIKSPMYGSIVNIPVGEGQQVAYGEALLTFKALGFETIITAPRDCKIVKIKVSEKDMVKLDEYLIEIE